MVLPGYGRVTRPTYWTRRFLKVIGAPGGKHFGDAAPFGGFHASAQYGDRSSCSGEPFSDGVEVVDPCGEDEDVGAFTGSGQDVADDLVEPLLIGDQRPVGVGHPAWFLWVSVGVVAELCRMEVVLDRPPPIWPHLKSRCWWIRSRHWSASALRSTRTSVEVARASIAAQVMTVLPVPGGAISTPASWLSTSAIARVCVSRSFVAQVNSWCSPMTRWSSTLRVLSAELTRSLSSRCRPRGRVRLPSTVSS